MQAKQTFEKTLKSWLSKLSYITYTGEERKTPHRNLTTE